MGPDRGPWRERDKKSVEEIWRSERGFLTATMDGWGAGSVIFERARYVQCIGRDKLWTCSADKWSPRYGETAIV